MTENERIEALIRSQGSRYVNVRTILRSGEIVDIVFNPKELARRLAERPAVSIAGAKAAATRKERHPNLVSVWDVSPRKFKKYAAAFEAANPGKKYRGDVSAYDVNNVLAIKANKVWHHFRQPRQPYNVATPIT